MRTKVTTYADGRPSLVEQIPDPTPAELAAADLAAKPAQIAATNADKWARKIKDLVQTNKTKPLTLAQTTQLAVLTAKLSLSIDSNIPDDS